MLKKRKRPRAMTPTSPITPAVSSPAQSDQALMSPIERLALDKRSPSDGQPDSFDTFVAAQTSSAFPIHEDDRSTADKTSRSTAVLRELAPAVTSHSPSRIGAAFHGPLDQTPRPTRVPIVSSFVPDLGSEFGQGLNGIASNSGPSPTPLDYSVSVPASVQWSDTVRMPQNPYGHDAAWSYNAHLFHGMPNGPQVPADEQTPLLSGDLMSFPTTALGGRPEMPAYSPRQARSQPMQYQLSPGQTSSSQTMPFDPVACQSQQNPYHGQAHQAVDNRYGYRKA